MTTRRLGAWLAYAGGGFAVATSALGSGFSPWALPFAAWSLVPYVGLWFFSRWTDRPGPVLGAGLAALAGEAAVRATVFLWPEHSTAAVALLFSPGYLLLILMPAGGGLGFVLSGVWEKGGVFPRAGAVLIGAAALAFEFLAIAAPERLPMNVAKTKAALARIGPPRVVVPGRFETVLVSSAAAWHQVVDYDGKPGDEIALVDHRGARFIDLRTFAPLGERPFSGDPGRLWSWMSQLVFLEDGLGVVQTGGGFSETKAQRLDGSPVWAYKPDARLNPTALAPADLDGDGRGEFYAASNAKVARLDLSGREVWARPARSALFLGALPARGASPAWVAAVEYGRRALAWDARGEPVGEHAVTAKDMPFAVADTPWGRAFLHGGKTRPLRGVSADGRELFSLPMGDFTAIQAVGLDLASGPALAVLGDTPKDVGRVRLFITDARGGVLYDEVLSRRPVLRAARRPDGISVLLLSRDGLRVLRERGLSP